MVHGRGGCLAIMLATLWLLAGCSKGTPTSPVSSGGITAGPGTTSPSSSASVLTFILPEASGTIRRFPELGVFDNAPVAEDVQSTYFRTTDVNREFRRGIAEFAIPRLTEVYAARLVLRETRATLGEPVPPDLHELVYYRDVDLIVNTSDYDRPASRVGSFETDANLPTMVPVEFDVSRLVAESRGDRLGFRVRLEVDPAEAGFGFLGSGFGRYTTPAGVRIEVATTPVDAIDILQKMVRGMGHPPDVEARLLAPLRTARSVLSDGSTSNDSRACSAFRVFLDEVEAGEQANKLSSTQAWDLRELGLNLVTGLGCPS